MEGNITASHKVQLLKPAVVIGDVHSPAFSMEDGVYFHGMCDMGAAPAQVFDIEADQTPSTSHDSKNLQIANDSR